MAVNGKRKLRIFALVLIMLIAGLTLISLGTARNIIAGSVLTLILIPAFPYIYDVVASVINLVTYPGGGFTIANEEQINTVVNPMGKIAKVLE